MKKPNNNNSTPSTPCINVTPLPPTSEGGISIETISLVPSLVPVKSHSTSEIQQVFSTTESSVSSSATIDKETSCDENNNNSNPVDEPICEKESPSQSLVLKSSYPSLIIQILEQRWKRAKEVFRKITFRVACSVGLLAADVEYNAAQSWRMVKEKVRQMKERIKEMVERNEEEEEEEEEEEKCLKLKQQDDEEEASICSSDSSEEEN